VEAEMIDGEQQKYYLESSETQHLREVMQLQLGAVEKARQIQAEEYERRLALLNHEAAQLKDMQAMYVPREVFEGQMKELGMKIDKMIDASVKNLPREIHEQYVKDTNDKIAALSRLVYIGMGILIVVEFVVRFLVK
jgi:hypothetical protein